MGKNYYYHTNMCEHCQRADVFHVGKKSGGWTFHFRGYRGYVGIPDTISLADWARVFKTVPGILVDEEERVVGDPLRFLSQLERPTLEQQQSEDSPERLGGFSPNPANQWRDLEGFTFYDGEFC